ncbi:hypothetical protein [Rubritalea sp.]|uniref:hypothetical protein n=1 Tax=Rubritalea sp. TaxID=2109375 RepID=UPI003EF86AD9
MQIIYYLASVASLVCWIITLITMFKSDKILLAILGIICPLWSFIWGWMNKAKLPNKNLMIIWTICIIIGGATASSVAASFQP